MLRVQIDTSKRVSQVHPFCPIFYSTLKVKLGYVQNALSMICTCKCMFICRWSAVCSSCCRYAIQQAKRSPLQDPTQPYVQGKAAGDRGRLSGLWIPVHRPDLSLWSEGSLAQAWFGHLRRHQPGQSPLQASPRRRSHLGPPADTQWAQQRPHPPKPRK